MFNRYLHARRCGLASTVAREREYSDAMRRPDSVKRSAKSIKYLMSDQEMEDEDYTERRNGKRRIRECSVKLTRIKPCIPGCLVDSSDVLGSMMCCQKCKRWCHCQCFIPLEGPARRSLHYGGFVCLECAKFLFPHMLKTTSDAAATVSVALPEEPVDKTISAAVPAVAATLPEEPKSKRWKVQEDAKAEATVVPEVAAASGCDDNATNVLKKELDKIKRINDGYVRLNNDFMREGKHLRDENALLKQKMVTLNSEIETLNHQIRVDKQAHKKEIKRLNARIIAEQERNGTNSDLYVAQTKDNNSMVLKRVAPEGEAANKDAFKKGKSMTIFGYTRSLVDDNYLYCGKCDKDNLGECSIHGPMKRINDSVVIEDDPLRANHSVPFGITIDVSSLPGAGLGVWTKINIDKHVVFGPYVGKNVDLDSPAANESQYCWDIRVGSKVGYCIDGSDVATSNWLRFVNCANFEEQQNLMAFQYKRQIFYRANKRIRAGEELLVWYGPEYGKLLGMTSDKPGPAANDIIVCSSKPAVSSAPSASPSIAPLISSRPQLVLPVSNTPYPLKCNICDEQFVDYVTLYEHKKSNHICYKCQACGERFKFFVDAFDHKSKFNHGLIAQLTMERDGQERSRSEKVVDRPDRHLPKAYRCQHCTMKFSLEAGLSGHMKYQHPHYAGARRHRKCRSDVQCKYCVWWFPKKMIGRHVAGLHGATGGEVPKGGGGDGVATSTQEVIQLYEAEDVRACDVVGLPPQLTVLENPGSEPHLRICTAVEVAAGTVLGLCNSNVDFSGSPPDDKVLEVSDRCQTCSDSVASPFHWLRNIKLVWERASANLEVFPWQGHVFYRLTRSLIAGSELLVWRDFGTELKTRLARLVSKNVPEIADSATTDHIVSSNPGPKTKRSQNAEGQSTSTDLLMQNPEEYNQLDEFAFAFPSHHPSPPGNRRVIRCEKCSLEFCSNFRLNVHLAQCDPEGRIGICCQYCNQHFSWSKNLKQHLIERHPEAITESLQPVSPGQVKCYLCQWWVGDEAALREHVRNKHANESHSPSLADAEDGVQTATAESTPDTKLPPGLKLCKSKHNTVLGVKVTADISEGTLLGPSKGAVVMVDVPGEVTSASCWQVIEQLLTKRLIKRLDAVAPHNWMRHINWSKTAAANLEPVIFSSFLFYRTTKHVSSGTELLVRYTGTSDYSYHLSGRQELDRALGRKKLGRSSGPLDGADEGESCTFDQLDLRSLMKPASPTILNSTANKSPPVSVAPIDVEVGMDRLLPHKCQICGCRFKRGDELEEHRFTVHGIGGWGSDGSRLASRNNSSASIEKGDGEANHSGWTSLAKHYFGVKEKLISRECDLCRSSFFSSSELCWHKVRQHHCNPFTLGNLCPGATVKEENEVVDDSISLSLGLVLRRSSFEEADSDGVWSASVGISPGTIYGPFKRAARVSLLGFLGSGEILSLPIYRRRTIAILTRLESSGDLAAGDGWFRHIKWSTDERLANLLAIHFNACVFYCAFKEIQPESELIAFDPAWSEAKPEHCVGPPTVIGNEAATIPVADLNSLSDSEDNGGGEDITVESFGAEDVPEPVTDGPLDSSAVRVIGVPGECDGIVTITYHCIECRHEFKTRADVVSHQTASGHEGIGTTLIEPQDEDETVAKICHAESSGIQRIVDESVENVAKGGGSCVPPVPVCLATAALTEIQFMYSCTTCSLWFTNLKSVFAHNSVNGHVLFSKIRIKPRTASAPIAGALIFPRDTVTTAATTVCTDVPATAADVSKNGIVFNCDQCEQSFSSPGRLAKHRVTQHKFLSTCVGKTYTCRQCRFVCRNSAQIWEHYHKFHHRKTTRNSTQIEKDLPHLGRQSMETTANLAMGSGAPVGKQLETDAVNCGRILQGCERSQNPPQNMDDCTPEGTPKANICHVCQASSFPSSNALRAHQFKQHGISQIFSCTQCGGQFRDRVALSVHQKRWHHMGAEIVMIRPVLRSASPETVATGDVSDSDDFPVGVAVSDAGTIDFDPSIFLNLESSEVVEDSASQGSVSSKPLVNDGENVVNVEEETSDRAIVYGSCPEDLVEGGDLGAGVSDADGTDCGSPQNDSDSAEGTVKIDGAGATKPSVGVATDVDSETHVALENFSKIDNDIKGAMDSLFSLLPQVEENDCQESEQRGHTDDAIKGDVEIDTFRGCAFTAASKSGQVDEAVDDVDTVNSNSEQNLLAKASEMDPQCVEPGLEVARRMPDGDLKP